MPDVVLLGDSIRLGYQAAVQAALADVAQVWGPEENGQTSDWTLAHLDEWVIARQPALVHLNCGLWDLRREFGSPGHSVSLAVYRQNVITLLARVRRETAARIIWATITPVNEEWHNARKPFARYEADVMAYNEAAMAVCREQAMPVHDLYRVVMNAGRDRYLDEDGVHYGEAGYQLLGNAVAATIRAELSKE